MAISLYAILYNIARNNSRKIEYIEVKQNYKREVIIVIYTNPQRYKNGD